MGNVKGWTGWPISWIWHKNEVFQNVKTIFNKVHVYGKVNDCIKWESVPLIIMACRILTFRYEQTDLEIHYISTLRHLDPRGTKVKPVISRCCHNDNPHCPQWQHSWHHDNSAVLGLVFAWYSKTVEANICYSCKAHSPNTADRPWTDGWYLLIHHRIHDLIHAEGMKVGSFWWPTWAFATTMSCQTNS